ncbi:polyribonucleotide nucleotidyltransferase [Candidatus Saccharibacteria bacterium]|jgi:polyribonucleotide nucleotidyltransferase|nr:polyribonucleotide nucleotidyltransferase [Candidatus Saccharibacteria bacterium]
MATINPFGKEIINLETEFCGRTLKFEINRLAFQSSAVTVTYGDTVVQGVALAANHANPHATYFPLMIDYEEKFYATGKISGSRFIKREGRPSEQAVLTARLIDRPIRPLFPKGYQNEVQALAQVLSVDPELKPDTIAMIAVSTAIMMTGAPFDGPVAGVRVGKVDGKLIAYPDTTQLEDSELDLTVAGTADAIMMVEAGAKEVSESDMVDALQMAHQAIQPAIELQNQLVEKLAVIKQEFEVVEDDAALTAEIEAFLSDKMGDKLRNPQTDLREQAVRELREQTVEHFVEDPEAEDAHERISQVKEIYAHAMKREIRRGILEDGLRPDNRKSDTLRPLSSEVGVLPRTHGSSIFTRGLTQSLNITTLASLSYSQLIDNMESNTTKRFMHHYNFPAWSVGEISRPRSAGRREIGHGALAERALEAVLPSEDDFPYAIRSVSEIMSSAGSTSMAAVCSGTLSLMDAGVPITKPVSGIAMGLMSSDDKKVILSDIMDEEDFAGDMDFKVAGTADGITALQMDIKVKGVSRELLEQALEQAKVARLEILDNMLATLDAPRKELSQYAPRIETISINPEKIGAIIGKGGEMIKKITQETGAEIDIQDDGTILIAAADQSSRDDAIKWIKELTIEPEVGQVYDGTVVAIKDFGVFVEILPGIDGMVHISEMADQRVEHPGDIVKVGDTGPVKVIEVDGNGRIKLSMKQV